MNKLKLWSCVTGYFQILHFPGKILKIKAYSITILLFLQKTWYCATGYFYVLWGILQVYKKYRNIWGFLQVYTFK